MTRTRKKLLVAALAAALTIGSAASCKTVKGVGNSTGNKVKQGGEAGGSMGY